MSLTEKVRQWIERQLLREQQQLSRSKRILINQLRLYVYVIREILSGEYLVRASALVYATMLAIVPVATVGFTFYRAFGGLQSSGVQTAVSERIAAYFFSDEEATAPPPARAPEPEPAQELHTDTPPEESGAPPESAAPPRPGTAAAPPAARSPRWSRGVLEQLSKLVDQASSAQTNVLSVALLVLSAVLLFNTIETTFNRIWRVERRRSFWVKFPAFFTTLILGPLLIGLSIGLTSFVGFAVPILGQRVLARCSAIVTTTVALFIGYSLLPYTRVRWRPALTGALVAAVVWEVAKAAFALYIQTTVSYSAIYGPLAAFPIFLLWLYMSWIIVLFGAGLSYVTQNINRLAESHRAQRRRAPLDSRLALAILSAVSRSYIQGVRPPSVDRLADTLGAEPADIATATAEMTERGLLLPVAAADGRPFVPARPPDRIRVLDVIEQARQSSAALCDIRDTALRAVIDAVFQEISASSRQAASLTLAEVNDRIAALEPRTPAP